MPQQSYTTTLSPRAQDLMVLAETIESHKGLMADTLLAMADLRRRLGKLADTPGTGMAEHRRLFKDLSAQLVVLTNVLDALSGQTVKDGHNNIKAHYYVH